MNCGCGQSVCICCDAVEKLNAVHVLMDTFGGSRTISNTSTTNYTQISTLNFDHSGQIVSAAFQVAVVNFPAFESFLKDFVESFRSEAE